MKIRYSESFRKDLKRIKDKSLRLKIIKALNDIAISPEKGKPLKYGYKGNRRMRIGPFRILYKIEKNIIWVSCFEHRSKVYR